MKPRPTPYVRGAASLVGKVALLAGLLALAGPAVAQQTTPELHPVPASVQHATTVPYRASATGRPATAPVHLRLSPEEGESLVYTYRLQARLEAPPEFGGNRRVETRMRLRQTAREVSGDTLRYLMQIQELAMESDSATRSQLLDPRRFEGKTLSARITRRGEVLHLGSPGARKNSPQQIEQSMLQAGFPTLPDGPVRVGQTWTDTARMPTAVLQGMGGGNTVAVSRTTLEGVEREGTTQVARLAVETTFDFLREGRGGQPLQADMSGSGRSTVRFDVDRGRYLSSTGTQSYRVEMKLPGSADSVSIRFDVDSEVRLTDSSDGDGGG